MAKQNCNGEGVFDSPVLHIHSNSLTRVKDNLMMTGIRPHV